MIPVAFIQSVEHFDVNNRGDEGNELTFILNDDVPCLPPVGSKFVVELCAGGFVGTVAEIRYDIRSKSFEIVGAKHTIFTTSDVFYDDLKVFTRNGWEFDPEHSTVESIHQPPS
jgi:hypothetical protein